MYVGRVVCCAPVESDGKRDRQTRTLSICPSVRLSVCHREA